MRAQFVDETEITGHEAMGVLNLGKPSRGEALYRTVLDNKLTRRNRTYYGALLSDALLKQGAREHAIAEGMNSKHSALHEWVRSADAV